MSREDDTRGIRNVYGQYDRSSRKDLLRNFEKRIDKVRHVFRRFLNLKNNSQFGIVADSKPSSQDSDSFDKFIKSGYKAFGYGNNRVILKPYNSTLSENEQKFVNKIKDVSRKLRIRTNLVSVLYALKFTDMEDKKIPPERVTFGGFKFRFAFV